MIRDMSWEQVGVCRGEGGAAVGAAALLLPVCPSRPAEEEDEVSKRMMAPPYRHRLT